MKRNSTCFKKSESRVCKKGGEETGHSPWEKSERLLLKLGEEGKMGMINELTATGLRDPGRRIGKATIKAEKEKGSHRKQESTFLLSQRGGGGGWRGIVYKFV